MKNKWIEVLRDILRVYNINSKSVLYEFCHPMVALPPSNISGVRYIFRSVLGLLIHLFSITIKKNNRNIRVSEIWKKRIWLIGTTKNQLECLDPVGEVLGESCAVIEAVYPQNIFSESKFLSLSLGIYPIAFWRLNRVPNVSFKNRCRLLDIFSRALGEGLFWAGKFRLHQPDLVVVANDHSIRNRIIMALARSAGIKVVYIQHAAVGGIEPPLEAMDIALLHGFRSFDMYRRRGKINAKVYCVGAPKLDEVKGRDSEHSENKRVAICPSLLDDILYAEPFFKRLKEKFSTITFILRVHPRATNKNLWKATSCRFDIEWCDSTKVSVRDFIEQCDAMVVSDSNIGLEAMALGCPIIVTTFGANKRDPYGFIKEGLYDDCFAETNIEFDRLLKNFLETGNVNSSQIQQHFANIGTQHEGNAAFLSAIILKAEADGKIVSNKLLNKTVHDGVEVYVPA